MSVGIVTYIYPSLSQGRGPKSTSNKQSVGMLIRKRHGEEGDEETKEPESPHLKYPKVNSPIPLEPLITWSPKQLLIPHHHHAIPWTLAPPINHCLIPQHQPWILALPINCCLILTILTWNQSTTQINSINNKSIYSFKGRGPLML